MDRKAKSSAGKRKDLADLAEVALLMVLTEKKLQKTENM